MKPINFPMLLLAFCVVALFCGIGIAISHKSIPFIILCTVLGFAVMGLGIRMKLKKNNVA